MCFVLLDAITAVGSFSLKANELLQWVIFFFSIINQPTIPLFERKLYFLLFSICRHFYFVIRVIDKSMKNFKAFFRWLYVGKN